MTTAGPDMGAARRDATPLAGPHALDPLLDRVGSARCVLLGGAPTGVAEYHRWRAAVTRRLIEEKGFSVVALDTDWAEGRELYTTATGGPAAGARSRGHGADRRAPTGPPGEGPSAYSGMARRRWPHWIWADPHVQDLVHRLLRRDAGLPPRDRVGFFGLDRYHRWEALRTVMAHTRVLAPEHPPGAWVGLRSPAAESTGGSEHARLIPPEYEERVLRSLLPGGPPDHGVRSAGDAGPGHPSDDGVPTPDATERERYYRALIRGGRQAWNAHTHELATTLDLLLEHRGAAAKAVVWTSNAQAGDARGTGPTGAEPPSLGQLLRQRHGAANTVLTGFASHSGTVTAAVGWEGRPLTLELPPARPGSVEDRLHETVGQRAALFLVPPERYRPGWLRELIDQREVGVVYRPEAEAEADYVPSVLGQRYDAFVYLDQVSALAPNGARAEPAPERL